MVNWIDGVALNKRIDSEFKGLSKLYDRSTPEFRREWIASLRKNGFDVQIAEYGEKIVFQIPNTTNTINHSIYAFVFLVVLLVFFHKNIISFLYKWHA